MVFCVGTKIQIDVDDGSPQKTNAASESKEQRKQKVFNPLTDHKRDPKDVAYDAWRSKVGGLNMAVKAPTLKHHQRGAASSAAGVSHAASASTSRGGGDKYNAPDKNGKLGDDSYEYNMIQKVRNGPPKPTPLPPPRNTDDDDEPLEDEEEDEEENEEEEGDEGQGDEDDEDDDDEEEEDEYDEDDALAKYRKHKHKKKNAARGFFPWSKVTKNVRSYGEIVQMLSEQPQKIIDESAAKLKENMRGQQQQQTNRRSAKKYEMKPSANDSKGNNSRLKMKPSAGNNGVDSQKEREGEENGENDKDAEEDEELAFKGASDSNCVIN